MKYRKLLTFLPMLVLVLASCTRDPKVKAQRSVEQGNKFFARGKYKDASIMYRRAQKEDGRSGEAYYRMALTALKLSAYGDAFKNLLRAVELQPDNADAKIKLGDLYLLSALNNQHPAAALDSATDLAKKLLTQDPKSFDGHRLLGQISLLKKDSVDAIPEFQAANATKPLQPEVITPYFQALAANNRFPEAEKLAYQLIASNKAYSPIYDLLYTAYYRLNRLDDAERILKLKADNNPKSTGFLLQLASYYIYVAKDRPQAETVFKRMTDEKEHPDGHLIAGDFFFFRLHEFDRARAEYEAAINAFPKDKTIYQKRLVELDASTGNNSGANQLLAGILKENPKDTDAIALRAALMLTTGNRDQINMAVNDLQSLVTKTPDNAVLRYNLARALRARGDNQPATLQLEKAIQLRPDFIKARELLAGLYLAGGDNPKALKAAEDVIDRDHSNLQGHLVRSAALLSSGEREQAHKELDLIIKAYPQNVEARYQVAYLDYLDKDYKSAADVFGKLNHDFPKDHRGLIGVTETLAAQNRINDAIAVMQKALQAEPDRRDLKLYLANLDARDEKYDDAIKIFQGLLDKDPKNAYVLYNLGESYRQKGDLNTAIDKFRLASQITPNDTKPLLQLALVMDGTERVDESQPIYEQILKIQPDNPVALNNLAYLKAEKGIDLDEAQTMAQRARQKEPDSPEIADTLGWIYIKRNLSEQAVRLFQDLVAKDPKNPKFHYHFGLALYQKGDKPSAKRELELALKDKPSKRDEAKIRDLLTKL